MLIKTCQAVVKVQYAYGEPQSLEILLLLMNKGMYIKPERISEV
jgi:hypothetical protein